MDRRLVMIKSYYCLYVCVKLASSYTSIALNHCFISAERSQNIKVGVNSGSDGYASLSQLKVAHGENMDKNKQRGSD